MVIYPGGVDAYDPAMALDPELLNRPGTGYHPDVKVRPPGQTMFACRSCGSRYVAPVRMDAAVTHLSNCRNLGCPGPVIRT